jgi:hypothetical protein
VPHGLQVRHQSGLPLRAFEQDVMHVNQLQSASPQRQDATPKLHRIVSARGRSRGMKKTHGAEANEAAGRRRKIQKFTRQITGAPTGLPPSNSLGRLWLASASSLLRFASLLGSRREHVRLPAPDRRAGRRLGEGDARGLHDLQQHRDRRSHVAHRS